MNQSTFVYVHVFIVGKYFQTFLCRISYACYFDFMHQFSGVLFL